MSDKKTADKYMRPVRSFVLRQGRLTKGQDDALQRLWPQFGIERGDSVIDSECLFSDLLFSRRIFTSFHSPDLNAD